MSSLTVEEDQKWLPTHVQVTVLRSRGLRGKGKHGTSDVYTIIQLAKEKYSTCVVEKTTEPEWREECSFELQPGVLETGGGRSSCPAASNELVLIVMHRALMGLDVFLGQAVIQLDKVFHETRCVKNEWYKLNSKSGKKEKERGDIQVTVQFTRNNLTASMYDLVMKDKGASTFGKLKERIKGKKRSSEEDSASLPSGPGSLHRMRQRLPSDGGGEEDYEDDEGGEARRSKMRTFFLRGKLRKSSDTRSSTSLGSESSESSSRGGSLSPTAGISVVVSDLSNSPSNSSNLTVDNSPEHTSSLICEFGDEDGEITIAVPQPTVCVNGSHAYGVRPTDPGSGKPADSLGPGSLQKSLPLSVSLQNLRPSADLLKGPIGDGRRWSFDKPCEEEKAAIAAALEQSGPMLGDEEEEEEEEQLGRPAPPISASSSSSSTVESESQGKKQRRNLFSQGRSESAGRGQSRSKDESEQAPAAAEEKHKGWFGSKDSQSKPSLVVSPKLEPSTDPGHHPPGPPVDPAPPVSPLHHSNPFSHSPTPPPPMSPCNPFFPALRLNPFSDDPLTPQPLKPSLPPLPYLSSSRPPIAQLFPPTEDAIAGTVAKSGAGERPLKGEKPSSMTSPGPFTGAAELNPDSEWDQSFEAFLAGRLQSPEDLTADCKTQQNTPGDHPLEHCADKGASLPITDSNDALRRQPFAGFASDAQKALGQATGTSHFDTFAQFLETIPEQASFEIDDAPEPDARSETNQADSATDADDLTDTNAHQAPRHSPFVKLDSSSPDPGSSGIGSSEAEEDFLSCLSSYSDKFSASSSEEAEAQHFEKSSDSSVVNHVKLSESEDDIADRSADLSLADVSQRTVIQRGEADLSGLEGSLAQQSPVLTQQQPVINASEDAGTQPPNFSSSDLLPELQPESKESLQSDNEDGEKSTGEVLQDFSTMLNDSSVSVSDPTDMMSFMTPDEKLFSTRPSLHGITSSPETRWSSSDSPVESTGVGGQDASQRSPIPFGLLGDFLNASANGPSPDFDDAPMHTRLSNQSQSAGSLFPSLPVSADSQGYQTCESNDAHATAEAASGQEDSADERKPRDEETGLTDRFGGSVWGAEDKTATLEPSFTMADDFSFLPAASTDCYAIFDLRKLSEGGVETPRVLSPSPEPQSGTLHRCHSEGTLTPAFDELFLLPSFGSDPGAIQESSLAQPGPPLPSLTSFAPCLTPQSNSSPFALCSPPLLANAAARSPPGTAQAAPPMLQETPPPPPPPPWQQQQQQAANQQNSPHPVKPLTTATLAEEKRTEGRSVLATGLEKLKSTIHPGRTSSSSSGSSQLSEQETDRKKSATEGAGSYYHLNHRELVALLVQREADLQRQKAEFERQKLMLAKREVELRKLKPQVKDLEDYIDTLLVRIMEQKPTLLQVRSKLK